MERIDHYFEGVAWKYLSNVDALPSRSHQHEFGGLVRAGFRQHLGDPGLDTIHWPTRYLYLAEDEDESISVTGSTSWYDARRDNSDRAAELRLYYDSNPVTEMIGVGMFMIIAKTRGEELLLVFTEANSSAERQLRWLFGLNGEASGFASKSFNQGVERSSWASMWILDQLGIETGAADENRLEAVLERFGPKFPTTREFSEFARNLVEDLDACDAPDALLLSMMETEESLFRLLERHLVEGQLQAGFTTVEEFISFSLSVQNRRKSRAGYAFENHLEHIFVQNRLRYERGVYTENRSKPDFLFPGSQAYQDQDFPIAGLSMLGVKSSCKERWRQVLAEAHRIPEKHLATLEPAISSFQVAEMQAHSIKLVVPATLHETFAEDQQNWLFSIADFIGHIKQQQAAG